MRDNEAWLDELEMIREQRRKEYAEHQDDIADLKYKEKEETHGNAF